MSQATHLHPGAIAADESKRRAAAQAVALVKDGMRLGLGTGSTAAHFVALLGEEVRKGLNIIGVPTSMATYHQAKGLGIPLSALGETPELDLTVDGADEFDGRLRLIKGAGGALLREKIVAAASRRMIVIVDTSKEVSILGRFPLPVEIDPFGMEATMRHIVHLAGGNASGIPVPVILRMNADGKPFLTDGGHYILDCAFGQILHPEQLAHGLNAIPGVVEHGLFLDLASMVIIADHGGIRMIEKDTNRISA